MQETVKKVLNGDFNRKKALLFLITALLTVIVWNLPIDSFGIEGLTIVQQRVIAIFVMAVMLWLTEAIPAWATSVVIIFVLLFFVSDSAFKIMQGSEAEMGKLLDYQGAAGFHAHHRHLLDVHLKYSHRRHDAHLSHTGVQIIAAFGQGPRGAHHGHTHRSQSGRYGNPYRNTA